MAQTGTSSEPYVGSISFLLLGRDSVGLRSDLVEVPHVDVREHGPGADGRAGGLHGRTGPGQSPVRCAGGQSIAAVGDLRLCRGRDRVICLLFQLALPVWRRCLRSLGHRPTGTSRVAPPAEGSVERRAAAGADCFDGRHVAAPGGVVATAIQRCRPVVGAFLLDQQPGRRFRRGRGGLLPGPRAWNGDLPAGNGAAQRADRVHGGRTRPSAWRHGQGQNRGGASTGSGRDSGDENISQRLRSGRPDRGRFDGIGGSGLAGAGVDFRCVASGIRDCADGIHSGHWAGKRGGGVPSVAAVTSGHWHFGLVAGRRRVARHVGARYNEMGGVLRLDKNRIGGQRHGLSSAPVTGRDNVNRCARGAGGPDWGGAAAVDSHAGRGISPTRQSSRAPSDLEHAGCRCGSVADGVRLDAARRFARIVSGAGGRLVPCGRSDCRGSACSSDCESRRRFGGGICDNGADDRGRLAFYHGVRGFPDARCRA